MKTVADVNDPVWKAYCSKTEGVLKPRETQEQLINRLAPPTPKTLAQKYDTRTIHRRIQRETEL